MEGGGMEGGGSKNERTRSEDRGPRMRASENEKEVCRRKQEAMGMEDR